MGQALIPAQLLPFPIPYKKSTTVHNQVSTTIYSILVAHFSLVGAFARIV